ncbi:MAG: secondary thiamine-phosphate synthase enzyme YjbQ [Acidobacteriota bacterium]|nr:secondary thiamine-phosphate synthase enzyme YjbQ [Acidobacteriota bacterium]
MPVESRTIHLSTRGFCDVVDITPEIESALAGQSLSDGVITLFVAGSTAGLTTLEYEPGCVQDLQDALERLLPQSAHYAHNARWGDGNGFSHTRAALLGPSLQVPFADRELKTGTWQQVVLVDFDNRPRQRKVLLQFIGE